MKKPFLLGILLLAFALRVYQLDAQSLWNDEALTYYRTVFLFQPDPPDWAPPWQARHMLYATLVTPFARVLPGAFGLRWLSVLGAVLAVPLAYRLGRRYEAGIGAALLTTALPVLVYYAQEARQYGLVLAATLGMLVALRGRRWVAVALAAVLTALHVLSAVWSVTVLGVLLLYTERKRWPPLIAALGAVLITAGGIYLLESGTPFLNWDSAPALADLLVYARHAVGNLHFSADPAVWSMPQVVGLGAALALIGVFIVRTVEERFPTERVILLAGALVPPLALFVISNAIKPFWETRYLMASIGTTVIIMAIGAASLRWKPIAGALLALALVPMVLAGVRYYQDESLQKPPYDDVYAYIEANMQPGDVVLAARRLMLEYYLGDVPTEHEVRVLTTAVQDPDAMAAAYGLDAALERGDRVWVVWQAWWGPPPESWLPNAELVEGRTFSTLDVSLFEAAR